MVSSKDNRKQHESVVSFRTRFQEKSSCVPSIAPCVRLWRLARNKFLRPCDGTSAPILNVQDFAIPQVATSSAGSAVVAVDAGKGSRFSPGPTSPSLHQ